MDARSHRVHLFKGYFGIDNLCPDDLELVADAVVNLIVQSKTEAIGVNRLWSVGFEDHAWMPCDSGMALAADYGLLCAEILESEFSGRLEWSIGGPPKTNVLYNMPVLHLSKDTRDHLYIDPVGESVRRAWGCLINEGSNGLRELYSVFSKRLSQ